jgi:hypothetical protein
MACCAVERCADPGCGVCTVDQRFPPAVRCGGQDERGEACRFVAGHPYACKGKSAGRAAGNATRDGEAEVKRRDPTFTPRRRVGPHR